MHGWESLTDGLHCSEIQVASQSCHSCRSFLSRQIHFPTWVGGHGESPAPTFWEQSRATGTWGGVLISLYIGLYLISVFRTHTPCAGIQKADLSSHEGENLGCLYGKSQTNSHPCLQRSLCLQARVPKPMFQLKVSFSRRVIIKTRRTHQKKPFNTAVKALWKQKKANKGKWTGSQKPHRVAVHSIQTLPEVMSLTYRRPLPTPF